MTTGIQSICWFHYSGQAQSRRFLILSEDCGVKLFSFWVDKVSNKYKAKYSFISTLYKGNQMVEENYQIQSHSFGNFIFFNPGILLYMVDYFPLIYYPMIVK